MAGTSAATAADSSAPAMAPADTRTPECMGELLAEGPSSGPEESPATPPPLRTDSGLPPNCRLVRTPLPVPPLSMGAWVTLALGEPGRLVEGLPVGKGTLLPESRGDPGVGLEELAWPADAVCMEDEGAAGEAWLTEGVEGTKPWGGDSNWPGEASEPAPPSDRISACALEGVMLMTSNDCLPEPPPPDAKREVLTESKRPEPGRAPGRPGTAKRGAALPAAAGSAVVVEMPFLRMRRCVACSSTLMALALVRLAPCGGS